MPLRLENSNLVGDQLPVSLCLTAVPWDDSIKETLSPKLSTGTVVLGQDETRACQIVYATWLLSVFDGKR